MNNGNINTFTFSLYIAFLFLALIIGVMDTLLGEGIRIAEENVINELVEAGSKYETEWESFITHDIFNLVSIIDLVNWLCLMFVMWIGAHAFGFGWSLSPMSMGAILTKQMFSVMLICFLMTHFLTYLSQVFLVDIIGDLYVYIWDEMWVAQLYVDWIFMFYLGYHITLIIANKIRHLSVIQIKR